MHMTEVETHKARKAHRCEWCLERIGEGTEYKRYRYYDGGEAATIKMHPECMGAMQDEADHWGGDFEWTPGQDRPKVGADETANVEFSGTPAASSPEAPLECRVGGAVPPAPTFGETT